MTKVAYFTFNERPWVDLLRRQVLEPLATINGSDVCRVVLFSFLPIYVFALERTKRRRLRHEFAKEGLHIHFIPSLVPWPTPFPRITKRPGVGWRPYVKWHPFVLPFLIMWALPVMLWLRLAGGYRIFHGRSYPVMPALLTLKSLVPGTRVVFDPRSDFPEENVMAGEWWADGLSFRTWKRLEGWFLRSSDVTVCIAQTYVDAFERDHGHFCAEIIPNNVDTDHFRPLPEVRQRRRRELGISEDTLVFCYLGTINRAAWYRTSYYVRLLKALEHLERPWMFLFLTQSRNHPVLVDDLTAAGIGKDRYLIIAPEYKDVPEYLNVADIGTMLFEYPTIRIGTKITEYVAVGLRVLVNSNCLGAIELIKACGKGAVLELGLGGMDKVYNRDSIHGSIEKLLVSEGEADFAKRELSTRCAALKYRRVYEKLEDLKNSG